MSKWISVGSEEKPKHLRNYFIAFVFGDSDMHFYGEAKYHADGGNGLVDRPHFSNEGVEGMRVTHWMPIPKLPKESEVAERREDIENSPADCSTPSVTDQKGEGGMNVCKDCVHFEACAGFWFSDYDCFDNIEQSKKKRENDEACELFKATTDFVKDVRCKDCKFNVANMEIDENDGTDYSGKDIVCSYFMTDGLKPTDYCSRGERREE